MTRLLLVDDEPVFRNSLAQRLRIRGYEVAEAANGSEALRAMDQDRTIDLIITDLTMPGLRGAHLIREIRNTRPSARIIVLSAYEGEEAPGVWCCLEKPLRLDDLIRAIESARAGMAVSGEAAGKDHDTQD